MDTKDQPEWMGWDKIRKIEPDPNQGKGHNFGKSKANKLSRGESVEAPPYDPRKDRSKAS